MDTDSFILHIKTEDIFANNAKKSDWIREGWIKWKNPAKLTVLLPKMYSYLIDEKYIKT